MKSHVFSLDFHRPVTAGLSTGITSQKRFMKVPTLISLAAAVLLTSRGLAAPYDDLAAKGYRWVATNGPYACPSKDDLRQIVQHHTDETELQMIEQPRAYYCRESMGKTSCVSCTIPENGELSIWSF
jgi:hypothetical protein